MADANVYIRYLADASKLVTESKRGGRAVAGTGKSAKDADKQLTAFAGTAVRFFAGTAVAAGMAAFVNEGVKMADTADLVRKSWEKTYGAAGKAMLVSLEDQRKALGLAEFEMQQLLGTTGQLAQQQGMTKDESAAFASQLFTMAGDVAAFTGELDAAPEVLGAFQAAIRGEFDPLEQFGIKLSQAAINEKALEQTGKDTVKQLTDQEKQTALLALITDALSDEFGALTEAIEDGRTEQNELTADMKDAQEGIGQLGQKVKDLVNGALLWMIDTLELVGERIAGYMMWLDRMGDKSEGVFGAIVRFLSDLVEALLGVGDGAANLARRWSDIWATMLSPISGVRSALSGLSSRVGAVRSTLSGLGKFIPGFATGGVVGGPQGAAQLAVVHGGEEVLTPAQRRARNSGGGGGTINVTVNAGLSDPHATAMAVVDLLRMYQRTQGPLPFGSEPS